MSFQRNISSGKAKLYSVRRQVMKHIFQPWFVSRAHRSQEYNIFTSSRVFDLSARPFSQSAYRAHTPLPQLIAGHISHFRDLIHEKTALPHYFGPYLFMAVTIGKLGKRLAKAKRHQAGRILK